MERFACNITVGGEQPVVNVELDLPAIELKLAFEAGLSFQPLAGNKAGARHLLQGVLIASI